MMNSDPTPRSHESDALSTALLVLGEAWCGTLADRFPGYEGWTAATAERVPLASADTDDPLTTVAGVDLPRPVADPPLPFVLGDASASGFTDGELVTAILDPSHDITQASPAGVQSVSRAWETSTRP
jgi:hypothetical protein